MQAWANTVGPSSSNCALSSSPGSRLVHELREQSPSLRERLDAQIAPVEFDQIEGAKMDIAVTTAQGIELDKAGIVAGDCLAIDQAGGDLEAA